MASKLARAGAVGSVIAAAALAINLFGGTSRAQQDTAVPIEFDGTASGVAISDDGNIVVFRSTGADGSAAVVIHNRIATATATLETGLAGSVVGDPTVSGNGCVIAFGYSADAAAPSASQVRLFDRCLSTPATELEAVLTDGSPSRPALSIDGSVLVIGDGQVVRRFTRSGSQYAAAESFDGPRASTDTVLVADRLDVSGDGSVIVFASGSAPNDPSTLTVWAWAKGAVTEIDAGAWAPSVSADGRIVAYQDANGVLIRDRRTPGSAAVKVASDAVRPTISADGNHVVYDVGGRTEVASWIGAGLAPFDATTTRTIAGLRTSASAGPAIDEYGATIASDISGSAAVSSNPANAEFTAELFDLGEGPVDTELSTTVTFTNDGPATVAIEGVTVASPFVIGDNSCVGSIRPQSTCSIEVSVEITRAEDIFGAVTIDLVDSETSYATEVTALGTEAVVTVPTTTPGSTTGGGTTGTTGVTTTTAPPTTIVRRPTSTTVRVPTASTVPASALLSLSPATVDFPATVIDFGRQASSIEVVNSSTRSVQISGVGVDPAGQFTVVNDACSGRSVPANGRCAIEVEFAPTATGTQTARLSVQTEGNRVLVGSLSGTGAPPPTLALIPGVATQSQVVTITGSGFPAGVTLDVTWADDVVPLTVTVDGTGSFRVPVIVGRHIPSGPVEVIVAGIADRFDDVDTTLVVTSTRDQATSPGVLDGVGPNLVR